MKIQKLFDLLEEKYKTERAENSFADSGMMHCYGKLDYGFFPLGSGILSDNSISQIAEINEGGIMVLGNDFGTASYIKDKCKDNRESKNNSTLRNILDVGLDTDNTFFTNFYLGLREDFDKQGNKVTMTSAKTLTQEYKLFCFTFFLLQLEYIRPQLVLCMGKDVKSILQEKWIDQSLLSKYTFKFIPHPSFAHINWKGGKKKEIQDIVKKYQLPHRRFGSGKGMFTLHEGWDDPLTEEFKDYM